MQRGKITIDITMTATLRIELFKKTIESFFEYMFDKYIQEGNKLNLILNIDPIGPDKTTDKIESYIDKIRKKFDKVLIRVPAEPSFPTAFKWVWENTEADYIFHLEDDWELMRNIDVSRLIGLLKAEGGLALLRLAAFHAGPREMKNWNKFFPYNGDYYECPEEMGTALGFCGHPSLIKKEFIKNTVAFLDEERNPEKQFHSRGNTKIMQEVSKWRYGVYSMPGYLPLIRDIGRKWMVDNDFKKEGSKAYFVNWEKVNVIEDENY